MRERERNFSKSIKWKAVSIVASISAVGGAISAKEATKPHLDQPPINPAIIRTYESKSEQEIRFFALEARQAQSGQKYLALAEEQSALIIEKEKIIKQIQSNPEIFGQGKIRQYVEDIEVYYPIYKAAAERFDLAWYLLWIIHEAESTASRDERAFLPGRAHYGAMQRAKNYHPDEIVDKIAQDSALLVFLPQRHADDWKEIVWAAAKLDEDRGKFGSLEPALYRYSAAGPAAVRWQKYLKYSQVFGQ